MRTKPNHKSAASIRSKGKPALSGALLFILAAGAVPCGTGQQNAPAPKPVADNPAASPVPSSAPPPPDSPTEAREKQIASESAQLLKLATELKAAVDKTTKDTLSVEVIRKADAIERVARGVKEKIRVDTAAN